MKPRAMRKRAVLLELAQLGMSQTKVAGILKLPHPCISYYCRTLNVKLPRERGCFDPVVAKSRERAEKMAALYKAGYTLQQIGTQFGLTRERARQLMTKHFGISATDGGQHQRAERLRAKKKAAMDARCLRVNGCSREQVDELLRIGDAMVAAGRGRYQTPTFAFRNQRRNAAMRGIAWELSLWQWWTIWQSSGHWEQRGRGQGYVMCRVGDVGPYSVGNVFIATAVENSAEAQGGKKKDPSLPIGVKRNRSGRYAAKRCLNGVMYNLGTFDTPELAHAAYLLAADNPPATPKPRETRGYVLRKGRYNAYIYKAGKYIYLGAFGTADEAHAAHLTARAA